MTSISGTSASNAWSNVAGNRAEKMQQRMFAKADSNGDGSVDKTELQTLLDKVASKTGTTAPDADDVFSKMDSDGSGGISSTELDAGMKSLMPAPSSTVSFAQQRGGEAGGGMADGGDLFSKVDSNGDGSIDESELAAMMANGPGGASSASSTSATDGTSSTSTQAAALFKKLDTDGDGKISSSEFDAGKPSGPPPGPPPGMDDSGSSTTGVTSDIGTLMQDIFKAADTNGDGTLSKTETDTLKTKVEAAFDQVIQSLQATSSSGSSGTYSGSSSGSSAGSSSDVSSDSSSSTAASSQTQSQDSLNLATLLDKVLKQYTAVSADALQQSAGSLITTSA